MGRSPCSLAELDGLVRVAEPDNTLLGQYVGLHADALAERLAVDVDDLRSLIGVSDREAAPVVRCLLQRRAEQHALDRRQSLGLVAVRAADHLARTAVWTGRGMAIDVSVLLGELLADRVRTHITFDALQIPAPFEASVARAKLVEAARVLAKRTDLGAWVDRSGLHVRWRQGLGGLNLVPATAVDPRAVLRVVFSQRVPVELRPTRVVPRRPPLFGFLADALSDLLVR